MPLPPVLSTKLRRVAPFFGIDDLTLQFYLGQTIAPVFDVAPYVRVPALVGATADVSAGPASLMVVPAGKRRVLRGVTKAATVGAVAVYLYDLTGTDMNLFDATIAATGQYQMSLALAAGWAVRMRQGNVADSAIAWRLFYDEEDA